MARFGGIIPALITPFDEAGEFNPAACEKLVERLYSAEVDGLYICGTTGEGMLQTVAQRRRVAETVLAGSPRDRQVIVHVGASSLADALELGRHAAKLGAAAISSLPPAGPYSFDDIATWYRTLAAGCDLPLLIYFMPAGGSPFSTIPQMLDLCSTPNIIGLKYTDHDLYRMSEVKKSGATIFNGYDEVLCAGLLMGADGGIGSFYNLVPELFVGLYRAARAGEWQVARQLQSRINELITLTLRLPLFPAMKTMLKWSGIDCGPVLAPRRRLTPDETARLAALLAASDFADAPFARPGA